ncbi:MAG: DEAD/DEAH box helicase family protein, partial [Leptonema sp. (in: Bacteria)]|nr:DEAD/DEAH box helicase family protein [Leptonema sp. (in: bacteria)]
MASFKLDSQHTINLFDLPIQSKEVDKESYHQLTSPLIPILVYLAHRIRLSHSFDKLSSLSNSRTRLLPHQIEATHRVCSALRPRFLLADEVGLGKTIEAGLVMKELMLRKGYKKILVITPATLTVQWQSEMKNRFNEEFVLLNRSNFQSMMAKASRQDSIRLITSVDFIKNEKYNEPVLKLPWDMAVFDEA